MRRAPIAAIALAALLAFASSSSAASSDPGPSNDAIPALDQMHPIQRIDAASGPHQIEALVPTTWAPEGNAAGVNYVWSCTTVGDVNADGYSDVMVTVDGTTSGTGQCHLFFGGPSGLSASPAWSRTNFT